jgi:hypothetical protein
VHAHRATECRGACDGRREGRLNVTAWRWKSMPRSILLSAGILWAAAVAFGFARMLRYGATPGDAGTPSPAWPAGSGLQIDRRRANLVMIAHPRCPCTRASIAELARVITRAPPSVSAHVLFYRPRSSPRGWERTDLWRSAAAIPGVTVRADPEGREARRFGARTSGHVLLYDRAGQLLFSGGITGARGHLGDNAGSDRVIRLLTRDATAWTSDGAGLDRGSRGARGQTCVFGCPLAPDRVGIGR